jgi:hypothetical protein
VRVQLDRFEDDRWAAQLLDPDSVRGFDAPHEIEPERENRRLMDGLLEEVR